MENLENKIPEQKEIPLIEWLNCKKELRQYFTNQEINDALKTVGYSKEDLTNKENFERGEPTHQMQEN